MKGHAGATGRPRATDPWPPHWHTSGSCPAGSPKTMMVPSHCPPVSGCAKSRQERRIEMNWRVVITVANSSAPKLLIVWLRGGRVVGGEGLGWVEAWGWLEAGAGLAGALR